MCKILKPTSLFSQNQHFFLSRLDLVTLVLSSPDNRCHNVYARKFLSNSIFLLLFHFIMMMSFILPITYACVHICEYNFTDSDIHNSDIKRRDFSFYVRCDVYIFVLVAALRDILDSTISFYY